MDVFQSRPANSVPLCLTSWENQKKSAKKNGRPPQVWFILGRCLQAKEHHPNHYARGWQHHVVGVLCCRRDWCTSQNRWQHEAGKLCGYIEATSQDISKESQSLVANGSSKWTMTPSILPKLWQNGIRTTKSGTGVAITKP